MNPKLLTVLLATLALGLVPAGAQAKVVWMCHPSMGADQPCEYPLDTTVYAPDGSTTTPTEPRAPIDRRPVDCFYVYPTVDNQVALNQTQTDDPEIQAVTRFQVSRFSSLCRMFVPVYRSITFLGIAANGFPAAVPGGPTAIAYADVAEAWKDYLAHHNNGRGVILLGHSQGSLMLRNLVRREIDPQPDVRRRLVGAFLLGGNVTTAAGKTTGGDFQHIPLCTAKGQFGCVVAYSTYQQDPPPVALLGNTNTDVLTPAFGEPHGPGYEVACTDPATLSGETGPASVLIPNQPFPPGFIALALTQSEQAFGPHDAKTAWIEDKQYAGSCRTINGAHVYRYDPVGGSPSIPEQPAMGSHLVDWNLGLRRDVVIGRLQTGAYLKDGFAVSAPRARTIRITVPGAGTVRVLKTATVAPRVATAAGPGTLTLRLRPRQRQGRRALTVRLRYTPTALPAITDTLRVRR